jgi:uncharacterized protein YndB with AHSA1/START domain
MRSVHVTRMIPAPPEPVFDRLADHANYERFRPIHASRLLREGEPAPNGVGAMREIKVRPLRFEEEITAYERPTQLDYLIVKLNVPFEHHGGTIRLSREGDATHVDWRTSFTVPVPVVGPAIEIPWLLTLRRGFRRVLEDVERIAADGGAP